MRILTIAALSTILSLSGCGGGGGSTSSNTPSGSQQIVSGQGGVKDSSTASTPQTVTPTTTSPPPPSSNASNTPTTVTQPTETSSVPFTASLTMAPADGATLAGVVTLEVRGTGIENVELLPENDYVPILGFFTVSSDKTVARLNFDTTAIPNTFARLRISSFNAQPGSPNAQEIVVMQARTWRFNNEPRPFGTQEGRALACGSREYTDPTSALPVVCINGIPTDPPIPTGQCTGQISTGFSDPADSLPVLRNGTRVNARFYCNAAASPDGTIGDECVCLQ